MEKVRVERKVKGAKSSEKKDAEKSEGGKSSEKKHGKKLNVANQVPKKMGRKKTERNQRKKNQLSMDDLGEIVHYGTNVTPNEVGLLYREGRSSDTVDNDDTEGSVDINRNRDENDNADDVREGNLVTEESDFTTLDEIRRDENENVDSSEKGEENVDDNRNEEVTDRGNQEDENLDDNRNEEVTDTGYSGRRGEC